MGGRGAVLRKSCRHAETETQSQSQRPHICREHFVTISICCFKTCLGLFCAGSFGVLCSCSCSCLLGGVGGIGFAVDHCSAATWLCFSLFFFFFVFYCFFESAFATLFANISQQQQQKPIQANAKTWTGSLRFLDSFLEQTGSLIWSFCDWLLRSDSQAAAAFRVRPKCKCCWCEEIGNSRDETSN